MEFTGERIVPKVMSPRNGMLMEHIARYEFARDFCKGRVLDIACGVGYGTDYLLEDNERIDELVGVDIDPESIGYAKEHYNYPNTKYFVDDCLSDELTDTYGTFDTIVSFETIEHFYGDEKFVQNLYNLLNDDGTLVISTPFGRGKDQPCSCPYHVYQYTEQEFWDVLKPFNNITMYHQIDKRIEIPDPDTKYYLMVAVCKKK